MGALLTVVQSPATHRDHANRVFNDGLVGRLAAMNAASRALRGMGYHVVREELCERSGHGPVIVIAYDRMKSLVPLLDRAALAGSRPHWQNRISQSRFVVDLLGVTVAWTGSAA
ncbi:hypothetical protein HF909_10295 [Ralstonia pseudosolanacearum]|uniref:Uncharacterized protein n=1 Tax=Ralstonia solanacearum TaxID=305 RepID=A0AA92K1D8_RALSL|nr:hypothetical protein [Ralstonia pseudosolanacearum]QOK96784.1 hypothetical protein HF909_10295 [Ralstonia pseudosolanacearum]